MNEVPALGMSLPRLEARAKASGTAQYCADLFLHNMLHGAILPSPYPHARITKYDTSRARALRGVKAVITGADIPRRRFGLMVADETALAIDKVRFIGDPVAAVAAIDRETAKAALDLIDVEYEELPAVFDPAAAVLAGSARLHEEFALYRKTVGCISDGNTMSIARITAGAPEAAWRQCDVIVEGNYETHAQYHAYLEPVAALAAVDPLGRITVWSSTQSVFRTQICISEALGITRAKIRAISPSIGGGFGGKSEPGVQIVAVLLAQACGKPVKIVLDRQEDMMMMRSRHPARIRLRTGARNDGTILVRTGDVLLDGGAYADDSPAAMHMVLHFLCGPYAIPNLQFDGRVVYTNKLRAGAFRGVGNTQATFACESQLDELAQKLHIDPIDLRLKNALKQGDTWLGKHPIGSASLSECLQRVRKESDWDRQIASVSSKAAQPSSGKRRGIGVSSVVYTCAYLSTAAVIRVLDDGSVTIATGAVDVGQGSDTVIAQMCAAALKLPLDQINVVQADTDAAPFNSGTNASRVTYMLGQVIAQATDDCAKQLFHHAAELLECAVEDLELVPGGRIAIKGIPTTVSFAEASRHAHFVEGGPIIGRGSYVFNVDEPEPKRANYEGLMPLAHIGNYVFGAQVVDATVDEATGKVEVSEVWSAHDVGRAVNRQAVEGQIEGGVVQGIGFALLEELIWDEGQLANPTFMDYKIPGALDVPDKIHPLIIENPEPSHPFGVKGIGEPPILGIAPAIANAVERATGVRVRKLPITSERVLRGMLERNR